MSYCNYLGFCRSFCQYLRFLSVFWLLKLQRTIVTVWDFPTATKYCQYLGFRPYVVNFLFQVCFRFSVNKPSVVGFWDFATATNCCHYLRFSYCNELLPVIGFSPICNKFFCSKFFLRFSVNKYRLSEFVILQNSNELL